MRSKARLIAALALLAIASCSSSSSNQSGLAASGRPTSIEVLAGDAAPGPASWAEIDLRLDHLAESVAVITAEVAGDGTLVVIHERTPDTAGAIGTAFSLYVLGIVTDRIAGGDLSWDDELIIAAESKSLPPGALRDRPDGSTVTVRDAAILMMSMSDNTATDLLIGAVGRDQIEYLLPSMGMSEKSQAMTLPLLTTRELFVLKWDSDQALRAEYAKARTSARRRLLLELPTDLPNADSVDPNRPIDTGTIEWFASPVELAMAQLWIDSQRGLPGLEPLDDVLAANSGVPLDSETWTSYSFAGGGEPGVLSRSWLLQRADGRRFVLAIIANDSAQGVDKSAARALASEMIGLLATT